jgi:hypothetical protein
VANLMVLLARFGSEGFGAVVGTVGGSLRFDMFCSCLFVFV